MRAVKSQHRGGLEAEDDYECTSLSGPSCFALGSNGGVDPLGASASGQLDDGTLVIEIAGSGNLGLAQILHMFKGGVFDAALAGAGVNRGGGAGGGSGG
jgi:hypothetical protein